MRVFAFLLLLIPTVASADLTLSAATHGSSLDLTFTNTGKQAVTMTTHVKAGLDHYDWLTVKLSSQKVKRTLHFIETRTKSASVDETIQPGKALTKSIDLALWAIHADNIEPLAPDTYDVEATWDSKPLKATAKTKLVIAAPVENNCKEAKPAKTGIELLARQVPKTNTVQVGLHNVDTVKHCVAGHIATHEQQSDWLTMTIDKKTIAFDDDRDKSAPMMVELAPGATVWTTWDVAAWAKRKRNGGKTFKGTQWVTATYDASREKDVWNGTASTSLGVVFSP